MTRLYEKHRPREFDEVVGQEKAVKSLRKLAENGGFGGKSLWLSGPSGAGKTTLARIAAHTLADDDAIVEYDSADQITQSELDRIIGAMPLYGFGRGGRAWIINEAHGLRKPIVRQLLGILERLPSHCVVIFTTTRDGLDSLFEDDIDAGPLLSRCIAVALTNQGFARATAPVLKAAAQAEGLDGRDLDHYVKLMHASNNNARTAFQKVEAGAMAAD